MTRPTEVMAHSDRYVEPFGAGREACAPVTVADTRDVGGGLLLGGGDDMTPTALLRGSYWPFRMALRMMVSVLSLVLSPVLLLPIGLLGLFLGLIWAGGLI